MKYIKEYNNFINFDKFDIEETDPSIKNDFKYHESFYNFLIYNGVLEEYISLFYRYGEYVNDVISLKDFLYDNSKYDYIEIGVGIDDNWGIDKKWKDINKKWLNEL